MAWYDSGKIACCRRAECESSMSSNTTGNVARYVLRIVPQEQRSHWDDFVARHAHGHVLQSWNWGELKADAGWHPMRVALWDEDAQQMIAAAQILRRSAPRLPLRAGHLAYIPKGPLIDWSQPLVCEAFFSQLQTLLHK